VFTRGEILSMLPELSKELAKSCIAEHIQSEELSIVLGRRSADERIAYLFLHLIAQIEARNVIREQRYPFPLRQQHIADTSIVNQYVLNFR